MRVQDDECPDFALKSDDDMNVNLAALLGVVAAKGQSAVGRPHLWSKTLSEKTTQPVCQYDLPTLTWYCLPHVPGHRDGSPQGCPAHTKLPNGGRLCNGISGRDLGHPVPGPSWLQLQIPSAGQMLGLQFRTVTQSF